MTFAVPGKTVTFKESEINQELIRWELVPVSAQNIFYSFVFVLVSLKVQSKAKELIRISSSHGIVFS